MKIKVLGSGSSGNCYLLQNENETLILECGLPYKEILKGLDFNLYNVVGCLVSHEHKDHSKAIKDFINNGIDVYTSTGTLAATKCEEWYRGKTIKSGKQFTVGNFTIMPFNTEHDAAEPLGFLIYHKEIGQLLFITDSYYCQYKFQGLNHILIECNYSKEILQENIENGLNISLAKRLLKSHFSLDNVKEFLIANDLKSVENIMLIHLSNGNSNANEFKEEIEKLTGKPTQIATKGLEVEI